MKCAGNRVAGGLAVAFLLLAPAACTRGGPQVVVRNSRSESLLGVTVTVTGNRYDLGDVSPGTKKSTIVVPSGESGIVITHRDASGIATDTNVGSYLEPGYGGSVEVDFLESGDVEVVDRVRAY